MALPAWQVWQHETYSHAAAYTGNAQLPHSAALCPAPHPHLQSHGMQLIILQEGKHMHAAQQLKFSARSVLTACASMSGTIMV